jgi:predicted MFS family arabinose efflux permease
MARAFSLWFPRCERGRANGVLFLGSRVGGMLSAPLALLLIRMIGWRATFMAFGAVGFIWAAAWFVWYRDWPVDHPAMSRDELAWIQQDEPTTTADSRLRTPWLLLLRSGNLWAICAMYFAFGYGLYFYFTWLPTYLIDVLGFSMLGGGVLAALPFLLAGMADIAGGWSTDRLAATHGLRAAVWGSVHLLRARRWCSRRPSLRSRC